MALAPNVVVVFEVNGQRKRLDYRKLPFSAWSELKAALSFTPVSLLEAMATFDLEAIAALVWLERKQHERGLRWHVVKDELETADIDFNPVDMIIDGRSRMGAPTEEEPDPTVAGN